MPVPSRPEAELLLCCAWPAGITGRAERIRALAGETLDWQWLLHMAAAHALTPLLYWELKALGSVPLPASLEANFQQNTRNSLRLTAELFQLIDLFHQEGIPVLPFKGPTLAMRAYGNLALREFVDLDLLVHKKDALRARQVLFENGYTSNLQLSAKREEAYLRAYDEFMLYGPGGGQLVELHWEVTPRYFSVPLDTAPFWDRVEPVSLGGRTVPSLRAEDLALILCLHGGKHCWSHLSMVSDLAWLAMRSNFQWDEVLEHARRLGSLRMVLLGAELVRSLLGTPVSQNLAQAITADPGVPELLAEITGRLFLSEGAEGSILRAGSFHMKARERWQDRVRYFARLGATITVEDWEVVDLPSSLAFLYSLLRVPRLVRKYWMRVP